MRQWKRVVAVAAAGSCLVVGTAVVAGDQGGLGPAGSVAARVVASKPLATPAHGRPGRPATGSSSTAQSAGAGADASATASPAAAGRDKAVGNTDGLAAVGAPPTVPTGATALGPLPGSTPVRLDFVLRPGDPSALDRFVDQVTDPSSPAYGHYLTRDTFDARFGPTPQTVADTRATLSALGLQPDSPSVDGLLLEASGTADQVSTALHVSLEQYRLAGGRIASANLGAPQLPVAVANQLAGIAGLSDLAPEHPLTSASSTGHRAAAAGPPIGPAVSPSTATGGTTPCPAATAAAGANGRTWDQLAAAYGFTTAYGATRLGAGETVALFELQPYLSSDIAGFEQCYGLPNGASYSPVTNIAVDGGGGAGSAGLEATLDIEDVLGLAPEADVLVYDAPNSDQGLLDEYDRMVSDDRAQVISSSWGECETLQPSGVVLGEDEIFEEAAAQGQTVFAASGDGGSLDCSADAPAAASTAASVDDPASQPYVTGLGGTTLTSLGPPPGETAWSDSGGGVSKLWAQPAWQSVTGSTGSCSVAPGIEQTTHCRQVPDVSASANPTNGDPVFVGAKWTEVGGTSSAAPLWASLVALADQGCGTSLGFLNPRLYALGSASGDFNDITTGSNGKYSAGLGYDNVTGLGTPDGARWLANACQWSVGSTGLTLSNSTAGADSVTYTATFTTSSAGQVPAGGTMTLAGPPGTIWPATAGDYLVTTPTAVVASVTPLSTGSSSTDNAVVVVTATSIPADTPVTLSVQNVTNPTTAGSKEVTLDTSPDGVPVTMAFTIQAADVSATTSSVSAATASAASGPGTDVVEVTLRDQWGNPVGGAGVALSESPGGSATITPANGQTAGDGTASFTVADPSSSQTVAFMATVTTQGDLQLEATAVVDFTQLAGATASLTPATAGAETILRSSATTSASGALAQGATIIVGAPVGAVLPETATDYTVNATVGTATVGSVAISAAEGSSTDDQAVVTLASSSLTADDPFTLTVSGGVNPTAAGNGLVRLSTSADPVPVDSTVTIGPGPVDAPASSVAASSASVPADGQSTATLLVKAIDAWGNPVSGATVSLHTTSQAESAPSTATSGADGQATFSVTDTTPESATFTPVVSAAGGGSTVDLPSITVSFTDLSGITFQVKATGTSVPDLIAGSSVDLAATFTASGAVPANGTISLTVLPGTTLPASTTAYRLQDGTTGGPVPLASVSRSASQVILHLGPSGLKAQSVVEIEVTGATNPLELESGSAAVQASGPGNGQVSYSPPVSIQADPASATLSGVMAEPAAEPADGSSASMVVVTIESQSGAVAGDTITLVPTGGTHASISPTTTTTDGNGLARFSVSDSAAEPVALTAVDLTAGFALAPVSIDFTAGNPSPTAPASGPAPSTPSSSASGPTTGPAGGPGGGSGGYWLVASDGGIFSYGDAAFYGSTGGTSLNRPIVGLAPTPDGKGYWLVASDGGIFSYGDAAFYGSTGGTSLNRPIVGLAPTPDGKGYWLVASDGGIFSYGDAAFYGSTGGTSLNRPIVGLAPTPDGKGYWLVASDGGIFSYGDAAFYGSTGGTSLNRPIVGLAPTPDGKGYWLVASDGGIFSYGDAAFYGSTGGTSLNQPIVGLAPTPDGKGYWLVASDGGIFSYGDAAFYGSTGGTSLNQPIVGLGTIH